MPEPDSTVTYVAGEMARAFGCVEPGVTATRAAERIATRIRSEAERETVRRITAWLRARADRWSAGDVGVPVLYEAAAAIDRKFGGEDKGGEHADR